MRAPFLILLVLIAAAALWLLVGGGFGIGVDDETPGPAEGSGDGPALGLAGTAQAPDPDATAPVDAPSTTSADLPSWPMGEPESDEAGTGRVFVRLVDASGAPLPNHPIEVAWWKAFGVSGDTAGRTDSEGRYQTDADATWQLESVSVPVVKDRPKANLYYADTFAAAPSHPDEVVVEVPVTVRIRGRVVDLEGRPVRTLIGCDAWAPLDLDPFLFRMRINDVEGPTDDDGRFELLLVAGQYEVYAKDFNLPVTTRALVTLHAGRREVELRLVVAEPVSGGRTIDVFVKGVKRKVGVTVRTDTPVFGLPPATAGVVHKVERQLRRSVFVEPGHYRIQNVLGDPWTVFVWVSGTGMIEHAVPPGATRVEVPIVVTPASPERTIRVVARLPDGSTVRPTVQPYRGLSLIGGGVTSGPRDGAEGEPVELRGDEPYHLVVSYRDMAYAGIGPIDVETAPDRIEVPLEGAAEVRVELVDAAGNPVPATFELSPPWSFFRRVLPTGQTERAAREGGASVVFDLHRAVSERGDATFGGLGSVPFQVVVRPEDGDLSPAWGVVRGGETLKLTVGEGDVERSIAGRVIDAVSGAPISGARIESFRTSAQNVSDDDGRFVLTGLDDGPAEVRVFAQGYAFPRIDPIVPGTDPVVLRLEPARRVPLRVLDADGKPHHGAAVMFRDADGRRIVVQDQYGNYDGEEVVTDSGGRVDALGVPAGHVQVEVQAGESAELETFEIDVHEPVERLVTLRLAR